MILRLQLAQQQQQQQIKIQTNKLTELVSPRQHHTSSLDFMLSSQQFSEIRPQLTVIPREVKDFSLYGDGGSQEHFLC